MSIYFWFCSVITNGIVCSLIVCFISRRFSPPIARLVWLWRLWTRWNFSHNLHTWHKSSQVRNGTVTNGIKSALVHIKSMSLIKEFLWRDSFTLTHSLCNCVLAKHFFFFANFRHFMRFSAFVMSFLGVPLHCMLSFLRLLGVAISCLFFLLSCAHVAD